MHRATEHAPAPQSRDFQIQGFHKQCETLSKGGGKDSLGDHESLCSLSRTRVSYLIRILRLRVNTQNEAHRGVQLAGSPIKALCKRQPLLSKFSMEIPSVLLSSWKKFRNPAGANPKLNLVSESRNHTTASGNSSVTGDHFAVWLV